MNNMKASEARSVDDWRRISEQEAVSLAFDRGRRCHSWLTETGWTDLAYIVALENAWFLAWELTVPRDFYVKNGRGTVD